MGCIGRIVRHGLRDAGITCVVIALYWQFKVVVFGKKRRYNEVD